MKTISKLSSSSTSTDLLPRNILTSIKPLGTMNEFGNTLLSTSLLSLDQSSISTSFSFTLPHIGGLQGSDRLNLRYISPKFRVFSVRRNYKNNISIVFNKIQIGSLDEKKKYLNIIYTSALGIAS